MLLNRKRPDKPVDVCPLPGGCSSLYQVLEQAGGRAWAGYQDSHTTLAGARQDGKLFRQERGSPPSVVFFNVQTVCHSAVVFYNLKYSNGVWEIFRTMIKVKKGYMRNVILFHG